MKLRTQTVQNGGQSGSRDVVWGREVITTAVSVIAILLVMLGLIVGAVVYNAREFQFAADDRASLKIRLASLEGEVSSLSSQLGVRVEKANSDHAAIDRRLDSLEEWRYGQTISGWKPQRGSR